MNQADNGALAAAEHGLKRSPQWPATERRYKAKYPNCIAGGGTSKIQVHHTIIPFHYAILLGRPDLENDERNLESISADPSLQYHVLLGHLDDYKTWNKELLMDAKRYHGWTSKAIRNDPVWQHKKLNRPKLWQVMSEKDKQDLSEYVNHFLPKLKGK